MTNANESNPKRAIKGPVLDGFADVLGRDLAFLVEIRDRSRDFEDTIVGAGAEI